MENKPKYNQETIDSIVEFLNEALRCQFVEFGEGNIIPNFEKVNDSGLYEYIDGDKPGIKISITIAE